MRKEAISSISPAYRATIGLEIHLQLLTRSKMFAPEAAIYGQHPNTQLSPITLAHPGTLPSLNEEAVNLAIKMGLATQSTIHSHTIFARKNYHYPDLPKGYQITQDKTPLCTDGHILIPDGQGGKKRIRLARIHMEEDTGKFQHGLIPRQSLIDFNRAGTPLIEIVTDPDIETAEEAYHFVAKIRRIARHLGISNGHMEQGSLRCDVNVSVRKDGDAPLGQRVEVKNINSMRHVKMAIAYEIERQVALYEAGGKVIPETRSFDAVQQTTHHQRPKESQREYRYFPEPDLSPLEVDQAWIDRIKVSMPLLPEELIAKFTSSYGLSAYDAAILVEDKQMALYYEALCSHTSYYKAAANWLMGPIKSYLNSEKITIADYPLTAVQVAALATAVGEQQVSFSVASEQILPKLLEDSKRRVADLVVELARQEVGGDRLRAWVEQVVAKYPTRVKAYQGGQQGLLGFFVGQVLALSERKANPKEVKKLLLAKLD
jgi:aspartyl-tRNA(Asn)/glutamyl-tRNA(Gln) amidotransferase subunit B